MKTPVFDGGGSLGRGTWGEIWLEEKTEGARTEAESAQLDEILYQLRLRVLDLKPAPEPSGVPK